MADPRDLLPPGFQIEDVHPDPASLLPQGFKIEAAPLAGQQQYNAQGAPTNVPDAVPRDAPIPQAQQQQSPGLSGTVEDMARTVPGALARALAATVGLPGTLKGLVDSGARATGLGLSQEEHQKLDAKVRSIDGLPLDIFPSAQSVGELLSAPTGGFYDPKTTAGKYTQSIVENVAGAATPGGIASKALRMIAPGLASEALGEATQGTKYEPWARTAGALTGGIGANALIRSAPRLAQTAVNAVSPAARAASAAAAVPQNAAGYVNGLLNSAGKTIADLGPVTKPLTGAEAIGKPGEVALAALGRRQGATGDALSALLSERAQGAPGRTMDDLTAASGIDPRAAAGNIRDYVTARQAQARPLYEKAFAGGSVAPLQSQLQDQFAAASSAHAKALQAVSDAENGVTMAAARFPATDNVYANSSGLENARGAQTDLDAATQAAQQASDTKDAILAKLQESQSDAANNVPGGVWSPRIQQFLDDPVLKTGIARGLEVQRLESLAKGEPFNPTDYAISGADATGSPIVSSVPNMRLLDAGKRGLDSMLNDYRDPTTGRMAWDQRSRAIDAVRRSYVNELDSLNPNYAAARSVAGDYLGADEAANTGQKFITNPNVTETQFSNHINGLSDSELEAFKGGIANSIFNMAQNGRLKPGTLMTPRVQAKLQMALGPQAAKQFTAATQQEIAMAQSGARMSPGKGSQTAELQAEMAAQDGASNAALNAGIDFTKGVAQGKGITGSLASIAGQKIGNIADYLKTPGMSIPVRDQAGQALMLPPDQLADFLRKNLKQPAQSQPFALMSPLLSTITLNNNSRRNQ